MASRKVFFDQDGNEMDCYANDKGDLYIGIHRVDDEIGSGFITLKKEDVKELIKELQELVEVINED
jgi:hypothetical protein